MRQKSFIILLILVAAVAMTRQAGAVPSSINYQGRITDAAGQPVSGRHTLAFRIYNSLRGGELIWGPQTQEATLTGGSFNVVLGPQDSEGRSLSDAFTGNERFLGITMNSGEEMRPRQQFVSAPHALVTRGSLPAGAILPYYGTTPPPGFLLCDGAAYAPDGEYAALYAVVGYKYGAVGGTPEAPSGNFKVPDLKGRFPYGARFETADARAQTGGAAGFKLTKENIPDHTHDINVDYTRKANLKYTEGYHNNQGSWEMVGKDANTTINTKTDGCDGCEGAEVTFMPKYKVVNYIIKY